VLGFKSGDIDEMCACFPTARALYALATHNGWRAREVGVAVAWGVATDIRRREEQGGDEDRIARAIRFQTDLMECAFSKTIHKWYDKAVLLQIFR